MIYLGFIFLVIIKIIYDVIGFERNSCQNHSWIRDEMRNGEDLVSYMYCSQCNLIAGTEDYREVPTKSDT